jgi:hypothetical protein
MVRRIRRHIALALAFGLAGGAACSVEPPTGPQPAARSSLLGLFDDPSLINCPAVESQSVTAAIGPLGGVLAVGNTSIVIPANAVPLLTTFTLTVPSSKYVEIEVTANGEDHFQFLPTLQPVVVTLDYGRCTRSNIDRGLLTVWNIDPATKALLAPMPSLDNKLTRTVTFTTTHFSGYAVAD